MTSWLWTIGLVEMDVRVCFKHAHNNGYAQDLYYNYYRKTFNYKAEVKEGLKITEKYWWEL